MAAPGTRWSTPPVISRVGHYHFVSSVSVYADFSTPGMTEDAPVATLTPEQRERVASIDASEPMQSPVFLELYGPLKTECERIVRDAFGDRAVISRPGLIIGPHDYMDRFPYWVARIAEGGEVLAPGRPERPVQVIDARDLAEWIVRGAESGASGTFTATGPERPLTMGGLLDACRIAAASDARFTWVNEEFLAERAVAPWEEMPMWLPERTSTTHIGILQMDVRRAIASGLRFRPTLDSARDVLAWERTRGAHAWRAGLAREKERTLLEAWRVAAASRSASTS
jgi:2'-hydroxyisoflavone reductase